MPKQQTIFANNLPDTAQSIIMYIPEGEHAIDCRVNGKAASIKVSVPAEKGEAIAAGLQEILEQRLKSNVRPVFDFDHKGDGPAAALPKRFFYEKGKGIMIEADWTGAGKTAIENRDYSYFSPTFLRDEATGHPAGLPQHGAIGALVNDPAFRSIERIAASNTKQINKKAMTEYLVKAGLMTEDEAKKDNADKVAMDKLAKLKETAEAAESTEKSIEELKAENADLKKKLAALKEAEADSEVAAAVTAGRIAPKDEDNKKFWKEQIISNGTQAISALRAIPTAANVDGKIITAGTPKEISKQDRIEAAQAKARTSLGSDAGFQDIWETAQKIDPEAFI